MKEKNSFRTDHEYEMYLHGYREAEADILEILVANHKDIVEFVMALNKHLEYTSSKRLSDTISMV